MSSSYYDLLGVSKSASAEEIKKAYRKKAMEYHPDRTGGDKTKEAHFKKINEAYATLSDDAKKSNYDRYGSSEGPQGFGGGFGGFQQGGFEGVDLGDLFGSFFGGGGGGKSRGREIGADIEVEEYLTFSQAYSGVKKTLKYRRQSSCKACDGTGSKSRAQAKTCSTCGGRGTIRQQMQTIFGAMAQDVECPACHGRGKTVSDPCGSCHGSGYSMNAEERTVEIPAGIDDGMTLRVRGAGHEAKDGSGDLLLHIRLERSHEGMTRDGANLLYTLKISPATAVLGHKNLLVKLPLIGERAITIEEGVQHGAKLRYKGDGLPQVKGSSRGDLIITIEIDIPKKVSSEQRKLWQELRDGESKKGFWG